MPLAIEEGDGEIRKSADAPSSPGPIRYSPLSLKALVCRCAEPRDDEAWEEFVSRVDKPIALTIRRTAWKCERSLSLLEVEDLRQDSYMKLWKGSCLHLRNFAIKHPDDDAILRYIRKTAANTTHDYLRKHGPVRDRMIENDDGTIDLIEEKRRNELRILLKEIDEQLKHCLTGPDQERDRAIFWLYFRQGMSTKEIASLPTSGLTTKGVGSVIERLKHDIREQIVGFRSDSEDDKE